MSSYDPPIQGNQPIFNPENFQIPNQGLTLNTGDKRYIKKAGDTTSGIINFTQQSLFQNGTLVSPALGFISQSNLGIYRGLTDTLSFSSAGINTFNSSPIQNESLVPLRVPNGGVGSNSAIRFGNLSDQTGLSCDSGGFAFNVGGTSICRVSTTGINVNNGGSIRIDAARFRASSGTGSLSGPTYSFQDETNSGLYRAGVGDIRMSISGSDKFRYTSTQNISLQNLNMNANQIVNCPQVGNSAGNIEILGNSTTGTLTLTGGALLSATSGSVSGQHLVLTINGTQYKIELKNP